ncbi:hypothetical protein AB0N64_14560 [Microbacterium sp. NPDC089318]
MPAASAQALSRRHAAAWRESVAGYLAAILAAEVRPRHPRERISDEIGDIRGDVLGLDGFTVAARYGKAERVSESLDAAEALAAERGDGSLGVVLQRRQGRETPEAYAVMTLASFAALCARLSPPVGA